MSVFCGKGRVEAREAGKPRNEEQKQWRVLRSISFFLFYVLKNFQKLPDIRQWQR